MKVKKLITGSLIAAALVLQGAAVRATAQTKPVRRHVARRTTKATPKPSTSHTSQSGQAPSKVAGQPAKPDALEAETNVPAGSAVSAPEKRNTREATETAPAAKTAKGDGAETAAALRYAYEFTMKGSNLNHVRIEHDAAGRGHISFERISDTEPITEEFELSPTALQKIKALWDALRFLDANENYQSEKQYPHLGTTRLTMTRGQQQRTADFNWTENADASALANEYRRAAEQSMLVFEIGVALENQPLEMGRLINRLDSLLERGQLSDPQQLLPLMRSINEDERVPLVTRHQVERLLKKIEKSRK